MENSEEHIWYDEHRKLWILGHDLVIYLPVEKGGMVKRHLIPKGFASDLGTIERWLWWLIAPFELSIIAVLIHDYLYRNGIGTRAWADWIMLYLMKQNHVKWWKRKAAYAAVRAFGRGSWNKGDQDGQESR